MKPIKRYLAVFLLTIFSASILPKELIHQFFHHEEADDSSFSWHSDGTSLSSIHNHCLLFQMESLPSEPAPKIFIPSDFVINEITFSNTCPKESGSNLFYHFLRGPPQG